MIKRYLIPFALILILLLAACSGSTSPEVNQAEAGSMSETAVDTMDSSQDGEMMDEESADAMSDEIMEEVSQDGEMMDGNSDDAMSDDMMDDSHDENMDDSMEDGDMMDESSDETMDSSHDDQMMNEGSEAAMDDMAGEESQASMDGMAAGKLPAWQTIALTNAATGEAFALADFQGKTVFVEPMATWCSNCRAQQGEVREAKAQFGEDVVFIGLSLETNLPPQELASYARDNGFDWTYAVMPIELLAQLADEFGRSITNAPSTPHFIIRPDGTFTELSTGIDPAGTIVTKIQAEQS